jgi:hypothetical protein
LKRLIREDFGEYHGDIHDAELLVLLKDVAEEYRAGSSYTTGPIEEPTYYRFE